MRGEEGLSRVGSIGKNTPASMAAGAGLDFMACRSRGTADGAAGVRIRHPSDASTLVQHDHEAFVAVELLIVPGLLCPRNVMRSWTMASLARDIHLRPRRGEPATRPIILLFDIGRVAFRTYTVPV